MSQDSATGGARHEDGGFGGGDRIRRWAAGSTHRAVGAAVLVKLRWQETGRRDGDGERGDVPGWVMVTLMTAGLVGVLYGVAKNGLTAMFDKAMHNVIPGK